MCGLDPELGVFPQELIWAVPFPPRALQLPRVTNAIHFLALSILWVSWAGLYDPPIPRDRGFGRNSGASPAPSLCEPGDGTEVLTHKHQRFEKY